MSKCFLSERGQGHVSNFYIVDLENFATASLRYTGDIHNSFIRLFITHRPPRSNFITSICSGLVVQVVSALLRGNWQDFN